MSLIEFSFTDGYHAPASGTVVFMPHRRHAANETEVLPKPFHTTLVDGRLTVDLEPTAPTWVWSVTHKHTTLFYNIPERDGITPHTELIPVAPSTLPTPNNAVEPAWWAELRQYTRLFGVTIARADEALQIAEEASLEATEQARISRHQASLSDGYMRQSRQYSYDSHDSARESESAADRSEAARDRAEPAADRAEAARDHTETVADDITDSYSDWHGRIPALEHKTDPLERNHDDNLRVRDSVGYVALEVDSNGNTVIGDTPVHPGPGYRIRDTYGHTALEVTQDGNTVIGGTPVHASDGYRIRDPRGFVALEVTPEGNTVIGGTPVESSEGYRIRDVHGRVALEVDANGKTHIHDPAFDTVGTPTTPDNAPVRTNPDAKFIPNDPEEVTYYPTHLNPWDRTSMINYNSSMLRYSPDEGETWELIHTFDNPVRSGIFMANGEVIIATRGTDPDDTYQIHVSTGFQSNPHEATWTLVHQGQTPGAYPSGAFSWSQHNNMIAFSEYGPKVSVGGRTQAARYAYLSLDYGRTFKQILDIFQDNPALVNTEGIHIHGIAIDPYWDRIWVTYGDDEQGTIFTDDHGDTWHVADHTVYPDGPNQCVGIIALPQCVLFATDGHPNGVLRISREQGKHHGHYDMEVAYLYDDVQGLTILCQSVWRANRPGDDAPVVFEFVSAPGEGHRFILTTVDGYTFNKVWEDPNVTRGNSSGRAYGPTATGKLLHYAVDELFSSGGRTLRRGPMPNAY